MNDFFRFKFGLILVIAIFGITSCNSKDEDSITEFNGIVLSFDTNLPMENVLVSIIRNNGLVNNSIVGSIIDSVRTNEEGRYNIKTIVNNLEYYNLDAQLTNYAIAYKSITIDKIIKQNASNEDTILLGVCSYLNINLVNNKTNEFDSVYIKIDCDPIIINENVLVLAPKVFRLYPQFNDTSIVCSLLYDFYHQTSITWKVADCITSIDNEAIINLLPKATTSFTIEY